MRQSHGGHAPQDGARRMGTDQSAGRGMTSINFSNIPGQPARRWVVLTDNDFLGMDEAWLQELVDKGIDVPRARTNRS